MLGMTLGDRYKIIEKVGVGGMALVYKAEDLLLKRLVAIKILKDQYVEDSEFSGKFQIEAQSAASLSHPNIVNVYDVGSQSIDDRKIHYIVMEYINGKTLKDLIVERGQLSNKEIVDYSIQIGKALDAAHKKNIIHRDIKPQNILITDDGIVKVADFGIARLSSSATITYTSSILGTVHYISPEQAKGKFIDYKSDIYSLGIVMYEMATGDVPFDAENSVGIALKHIQDKVVPPRVINKNLSNKLNDIIMKCLQKNPANRFSSSQNLIKALKSKDVLIVRQNDTDRTIRKRHSNNFEDKKNVAVYKTNNNEDKDIPRKKKNIFVTTILPILLALVLVSTGFFAILNLRDKVFTKKIKVPDVINKSEAEALTIITNSKLDYKIIARKHNEEVPKGYVIKQDPEPNIIVKEGRTVNIEISDGIEEIDMPRLVDLDKQEAENLLQPKGLSITNETHDFNDEIEAGKIIEQYPQEGEKVSSRTKISVVISKGKEEKLISMPSLLGSSEQAAIKSIQEKGLEQGEIERRYSDEYPEGTVMWQSYDTNVKLKPNTVIDLIISNGKEPEPNLNIPEGTIDLTDENLEEGTKVTIYNMHIKPPKNKEEFTLKITKIVGDTEIEVYNRVHNISEGEFELNFKDVSGTKFKAYYDDNDDVLINQN